MANIVFYYIIHMMIFLDNLLKHSWDEFQLVQLFFKIYFTWKYI
jgi:hypothetical protein